ncbi:MAG: ABC transporter ATP-binding protein [Proteobacteria bacterium]|nr:ABC transporter ATP-binding protein [Pseudomonadota bacterium]MBI3498169.1 ABC transporter ATP-binding protein [Pseudomonadota bacterium]
MSAPALEAKGIAKAFGGVAAVDGVSFTVPDGSLVALIGPNGAGKTTLFNLATNLFHLDAGEIRLYGTPLAGLSPNAIANLGLLRTFQTARVFPGMTALENVLVGAHRHVQAHPLRQMLWLGAGEEGRLMARARDLLELVGLWEFADIAATSLPMGAQKLVEVCRALMAGPRLLLLDEPAAGLNDGETAELATLLRAIRDSGITILVVEHNMSLVMDVADEIMVLDLGRLIAHGPPRVIQRDKRVIEAYLGQDAGVA